MLRKQSIPLVVGQILCCVFLWSASFAFGQPSGEGATEEATGGAGGGASGLSTDAAVIAKGQEIFTANCQACHAVHEQVVGPKLAKVYERRDVAWLKEFIRYSQKTIESGDEYAVALYEKFNKTPMPNHDFLTDDDIIAILSYIQDETKKGPPAPAAPETEETTADASGATATPVQEGNSTILKIIIIGMAFLLFLVMGVLMLLASTLVKVINKNAKSEDDILENKFTLDSILRSPAFGGMVTFVFLGIIAKFVIEGIITIGVQQGYAPEQPIPFSHKLHAGKYEIECKYCHTGVEKSKNANIPSLNICMNCHNTIRTTSPNIQKIYAHLENDEPIQWVRVHNLPDLAYFNHAQHVKVGGLDCENCHGPIQEMEIVRQSSLLTMGWCIDCHRETNVNAKGNEYYDNLLEMHDAYNREPLKVENIGGLECSKCHY